MRPIDADKLIEKVRKYFPSYRDDEQTELEFEVIDVVNAILSEINEQPTVEQKVHGHWIRGDFEYTCSCCGNKAMNGITGLCLITTKYCPNCGAKMDEEVE